MTLWLSEQTELLQQSWDSDFKNNKLPSTRRIVREWIELNGIKIISVTLIVATLTAAFCRPTLAAMGSCQTRRVGFATHKCAGQQQFLVWLRGWRESREVADRAWVCLIWWPGQHWCKQLLGDLLGGVREQAKPPTDSIITALVAGSLPHCCWRLCSRDCAHRSGSEGRMCRCGRWSCSDKGEGKQVSQRGEAGRDLIKSSEMCGRMTAALSHSEVYTKLPFQQNNFFWQDLMVW